jgi:hypothetical protein
MIIEGGRRRRGMLGHDADDIGVLKIESSDEVCSQSTSDIHPDAEHARSAVSMADADHVRILV